MLSDPADRYKAKRWNARGQNRHNGFASDEAVPLLFALSVCAGAALYLRLEHEPSLFIIAPLVTAVLVGAKYVLSGQLAGMPKLLTIILCGVGLGVSAGKLRTTLVAEPVITEETVPVMVEGWVSAVEPAIRGVRLRIKPHAIAGEDTSNLPATIRLTHRLDLQVAPGRFVRCWAVLRPPPGPAVPGDYDFKRQAWFEGLGAVGYVQGRCRGGVLGVPETAGLALQLKLSAMRRRLAQYTYDTVGGRAAGFAAALVSGDRSYMSSDDQDALRASGLAHLLAISGLHLGIVGGLVYFLFRRGLALIAPLSLRVPVQKPAALAALIAIAAYLVLSGASVSTQRAFVMSAIFFSAILIDRPALSLRSFSLAMLAVALLAPESVLTPGFQMSFAATGVLIAIYENWSRAGGSTGNSVFGRLRFAAQSIFVTSIAASLATAPFAFYHFDRLAPFGLLANLMAMPIVSILSVPAAGLAIILAPFGLAHFGLKLFGYSLDLILRIADWVAYLGSSVDQIARTLPASALFLFVSALAAFILLRARIRIWTTGGLALIGFGLVWFSPLSDVYWAPSGDVYINTDKGYYTRIAFVPGDGLAPLRFRGVHTLDTECSKSRCVHESAQGLIVTLLNRQVEATDCMPKNTAHIILVSSEWQTSPAGRLCQNSIFWSDILESGGLEIRQAKYTKEGTAYVKHYAPRCSNRPWRAC